MPKFVMDSMDEVHEEVQKLYTKGEDGKFTLTGIDGVTSKVKLDEFRTNNIELNNKLEAFKDIDPKNYGEMSTELEELKIRLEKSGYDEEAVQKIVEGRVETITQEYTDKEKGLLETIKTQGSQLETLIIDGQVQAAAVKHKITTTGVQDAILRARSVFKVEDGKAVGYDGKSKLYDATGVELQNIDGWVKDLVKTAPHLFESSQSSQVPNSQNFTGDPSKLTPTQKINAGLNK